MAKKFFYVCAGLLMLVVAYQVGAKNAVAQGACGPFVAMAELGHPGEYGLVAINTTGQAFEGNGSTWTPTWSVPGTPVALYNNSDVRGIWVLTANGDVYYGHTTNGVWPPAYLGNVCGEQPTAVKSESWGAVKERYRK